MGIKGQTTESSVAVVAAAESGLMLGVQISETEGEAIREEENAGVCRGLLITFSGGSLAVMLLISEVPVESNPVAKTLILLVDEMELQLNTAVFYKCSPPLRT